MDHATIEETGIVDRYILGQLPLEEREAFEDHFLDCPECLERLELTRRMRDGVARVALEEVAKESAVRRLGAVAALARLARSRRAGLLITAVLVAVLMPASLLWRHAVHLDRDLAEARHALEESRRPAPPFGLERELAESRRALEAERERSAEELETERRERRRLAEELAAAHQPQANTAIVPLSPERSAPGQGEPTTRITLAPSPQWVVLSLEPGGLDQGLYRATLAAAGRRVWQGGGLEPDPSGAIVLGFHSSLLPPGDYTLALETSPRSGQPAPVASFRFRVRQGR